MASTAHDNSDDEKEYFDDPQTLNKKVEKLKNLILNSKHFIAYTGAGISTACGIPDYRSGLNTVLQTGAGKWAKEAAMQKNDQDLNQKIIDDNNKKKSKKSSLKAIPSLSHMALIALNKSGYLKFLVSQNTDGLHRRSGFPVNALAELHGNGNLEICAKCGKQYLRDFRTRNNKKKRSSHYTDRMCSVYKCDGKLKDTIVNFGETLPVKPFNDAELNANKSDLCLAIGSSLTVSPANEVCYTVANKLNCNLIIINLQKTPDFDKICNQHIYAKCDDVFKLLMNKLNISIPSWYLIRYLKIEIENNIFANGIDKDIIISGIDSDGVIASIFRSIRIIIKNKLNNNEILYNEMKKGTKNSVIEKCEFNIFTEWLNNLNDNFDIILQFETMKHYKEPDIIININKYLNKNNSSKEYIIILKLIYDIRIKQWNIPNKNDQLNDKIVKKLTKKYQKKNINNNNDPNDDHNINWKQKYLTLKNDYDKLKLKYNQITKPNDNL